VLDKINNYHYFIDHLPIDPNMPYRHLHNQEVIQKFVSDHLLHTDSLLSNSQCPKNLTNIDRHYRRREPDPYFSYFDLCDIIESYGLHNRHLLDSRHCLDNHHSRCDS